MSKDFKITCVERLYRVEGLTATYYVKAKTALSDDVTNMLLHEDMELQTFLENYEITNITLPYSVRKDEVPKSLKVKIDNKPKKDVEDEKRPFLAGKLTQVERIYIIKNELPEWFNMKDFIDAVKDKGYSPEDSYKMWKSTWNHLSKNHKIERSKGNTASRKYRYIKDMTPSGMAEDDLKNLKEGNKVALRAGL